METFNYQLKREIGESLPTNPEQALSFLSAIIKSIGDIKRTQKGYEIVIYTEQIEIYGIVNKLLDVVYRESASLVISDDMGYNDKPKYEITFPQSRTQEILLDTEICYYDEQKYFCFYDGISNYIIQSEEQLKEYIKGAFLACGTTNIVLSSGAESTIKSTGYHLEFVFSSEQVASDFSSLLASKEIFTKQLKRKEFFVVYVQDFEQIIALLGLMGATKSFLDLQNENAIRQMRNDVNRQNNCSTANITKTVNASIEQLESIKILQETIGIENLDEPLKVACYLRLANPEESLDNLVKLSTDKISKSGLYHRFQKINKLAKELKK